LDADKSIHSIFADYTPVGHDIKVVDGEPLSNTVDWEFVSGRGSSAASRPGTLDLPGRVTDNGDFCVLIVRQA